MRRKNRTVGEAIRDVVKEYGQGTLGIYILEEALKEALGARSVDQVKIEDKLIHEWPRYQELFDEEKAILAKYQ